jgi:hypothetical protein
LVNIGQFYLSLIEESGEFAVKQSVLPLCVGRTEPCRVHKVDQLGGASLGHFVVENWTVIQPWHYQL